MTYHQEIFNTEKGPLNFTFVKVYINAEWSYCIFGDSIIFRMKKDTVDEGWQIAATSFEFVPVWLQKIRNELDEAIKSFDKPQL